MTESSVSPGVSNNLVSVTAAVLRPIWRLLSMPVILAQAEDFTYTTNNGEITITGYTGAQAEVVIPDEIFGLSVTRVEARSYRLRSP